MNVASKGLEGLSPPVPGGWHEFAHDRAPATSAAAARGEGTMFETRLKHFQIGSNWDIADTELDPSLLGNALKIAVSVSLILMLGSSTSVVVIYC